MIGSYHDIMGPRNFRYFGVPPLQKIKQQINKIFQNYAPVLNLSSPTFSCSQASILIKFNAFQFLITSTSFLIQKNLLFVKKIFSSSYTNMHRIELEIKNSRYRSFWEYSHHKKFSRMLFQRLFKIIITI